MKHILLILITFILFTGILSCENSDQKAAAEGMQDIVIVGGDTLGRNWDNLPTKEEAEQAKALGLTPEQYLQLKDEQQKQELLERQRRDEALAMGQENAEGQTEPEPLSTSFSDKMYKEPTYTIETPDGREVIVGSHTSPSTPRSPGQ